MGCPIRKSSDQRVFAPPRRLSQRITSFIACACQGIHQMPLRHLITLIANIHQTFSVRRYQQKDQLLEIQSVMAVKHINHNARLEQALATLTNGQSDYIFSSLFHTEHARPKVSQTWFFLLMTGTLFLLNTKTRWWSWTGSNRRPPACKAGALPAELQPLIMCHGGPGRT